MLTQREFLDVSELQVRVDGVNATRCHRDAVDAAVRASTRLANAVSRTGDRVNQQQLMRVYGALMWSLGRVLDTPEVCRVYVGSFHDEELRDPDTAPLLAAHLGVPACWGAFTSLIRLVSCCGWFLFRF